MSNQPVKKAEFVIRGATVSNLYVQREVKVYGIHESEVDTLSYLNDQATIFFTTASFLGGVAITIWLNWAFAERATLTGDILTEYIAPLLLIISLVLLYVARSATKRRSSTWEEVKRGSRSTASQNQDATSEMRELSA
jgi:amino acid permease